MSEERLIRLEEGQKRLEEKVEKLEEGQRKFEEETGRRFTGVENRLDNVENRLNNVENTLDLLVQEVRITNNTLQGVFNVGFESYKNVALQREAAEMLSKAYEEVFLKLSRKVI